MSTKTNWSVPGTLYALVKPCAYELPNTVHVRVDVSNHANLGMAGVLVKSEVINTLPLDPVAQPPMV